MEKTTAKKVSRFAVFTAIVSTIAYFTFDKFKALVDTNAKKGQEKSKEAYEKVKSCVVGDKEEEKTKKEEGSTQGEGSST